MGKLAEMKNKTLGILNQDREGAEVFEYVLIVSLLVALIVVIFMILGPAFRDKMNEIAEGIRTSGSTMIFGSGD